MISSRMLGGVIQAEEICKGLEVGKSLQIDWSIECVEEKL